MLICTSDAELKDAPVIVVTSYKTKKARADYFKCDALFINRWVKPYWLANGILDGFIAKQAMCGAIKG